MYVRLLLECSLLSHCLDITVDPTEYVILPERTSVHLVRMGSTLNLSVNASALHTTSITVLSCLLSDLNFNLSILVTPLRLEINNTHSTSICNANIKWNPSQTTIKLNTRFLYSKGNLPGIHSANASDATISDYEPFSGFFHLFSISIMPFLYFPSFLIDSFTIAECRFNIESLLNAL